MNVLVQYILVLSTTPVFTKVAEPMIRNSQAKFISSPQPKQLLK